MFFNEIELPEQGSKQQQTKTITIKNRNVAISLLGRRKIKHI